MPVKKIDTYLEIYKEKKYFIMELNIFIQIFYNEIIILQQLEELLIYYYNIIKLIGAL